MKNHKHTAAKSTGLVAWFLLVCFGYYYKALVCGTTHLMGADYVCSTLVAGVDLNHWFETVVYVPAIWIALYQVASRVFSPDPDGDTSVFRRNLFICNFAIAMWVYGAGIHIANLIEIWSREHQGIADGPVYEMIYFFDETFSHYVQFVPFFFVIGWLVIHDRLGRTHKAQWAGYIGMAHGVERAIGTIEGNSGMLLYVLTAWIGFAALWRLKRFAYRRRDAWSDFFFRYAVTFAVSAPLAQTLYFFCFTGFVQPSSMQGEAWRVALFALVFMLLAGGALFAIDRRLQNWARG